MTRERTGVFLNRLKFKTATDEFQDMITFRVNCYRFQFEKPMEKQVQYDFLEYVETLDLSQDESIVAVALWLSLSRIRYNLRFSYNQQLPFLWNLLHLFYPRRIRLEVDSLTGDILKELEAHPCPNDVPNVEEPHFLLRPTSLRTGR